MSQKPEANQSKSSKRLSPELAEVLHMLKSLESDFAAKPAASTR